MGSDGTVIILSGGMDSAALLARASRMYDKNNTHALTFWYGSKHNDQEQMHAKKLAAYFGVTHHVCNLDFVARLFKSDLLQTGGAIPEGHYADDSMKKTVVPFRNGIMLSIAVGYAESHGIPQVWFGAHAGDHTIYPDCRPAFIHEMCQAAVYGTFDGLHIEAPFNSWTKGEIVREYAPAVPWEDTYSCYKGGRNHCGVCGTCVERIEAFKFAKMKDPAKYEIQINWEVD